MFFPAFYILSDVRVLDDVIAHKRGKLFHSQELESLNQRKEDTVDTAAFKEIAFTVKSGLRSVPSAADHELLIRQNAALAVVVVRVQVRAAVVADDTGLNN